MRILHACANICDRTASETALLRDRGHHVAVATPCLEPFAPLAKRFYNGNPQPLDQHFDQVHYNVFGQDMTDLAQRYDRVICHRDQIAEHLLGRHPGLVYDAHDVYIHGAGGFAPRARVLREVPRQIHVSRYLLEATRRAYDAQPEHVAIFPNVPPLAWCTPKAMARRNGAVRVLWEGGLVGEMSTYDAAGQRREQHHRYLLPALEEVSAISEVSLELVANTMPISYAPLLERGNVIPRPLVPWRELPNLLAQADVVWCAFAWPCDEPENVAGAVPGKVGWSCAVGTPVILEAHMHEAIEHAGGLAVVIDWQQILELNEMSKAVARGGQSDAVRQKMLGMRQCLLIELTRARTKRHAPTGRKAWADDYKYDLEATVCS